MVLTCLPISCQLYGHVMLCTSCVDINDISHVLFIYLVLKLYTSTNCENTALVQSMLMSIRCVRSSALQLCTVWYGFYRWPFVCTQQVQSFRQVVWPSAAHALSHVLLYRTAWLSSDIAVHVVDRPWPDTCFLLTSADYLRFSFEQTQRDVSATSNRARAPCTRLSSSHHHSRTHCSSSSTPHRLSLSHICLISSL